MGLPNKMIRVRFEIFTAVTMKNGVFWDVTLCGSSTNRHFGGPHRFHLQGDKNRRVRLLVTANVVPSPPIFVLWLLVTSNVVPSAPILVSLMMEAIQRSETLVLTRATRRNISEDGIL
jgi:hypothetical protein